MNDVWQFRDKNGSLVEPYTYNDGSTQRDVVSKLIKEIDDPKNDSNSLVIMIGSCSSGKSAIALNLINHYGKGIIVTPTKVLEEQYERDYCGGKYNIGEIGDYIDVKHIKGRSNFICEYTNADCGNNKLPCTKKLSKGEPRYKSAIVCDYWSPVYPIESSGIVSKHLSNHMMYSYDSISGLKCYFESKEVCPYYKQFSYYVNDRIATIFNLKKWEIETMIGRKPIVPIEIIDEGDEFLDGLAYKLMINKSLFVWLKGDGLDNDSLDALYDNFSVILSLGHNKENGKNIDDFIMSFIDLLSDNDINSNKSQEVLSKLILLNSNIDDCMPVFDKYSNSLTLFIPRFDIPLKTLMNRSGKMILMSATMQKVDILKSIYKINPIIVYAEKDFIGTMNLVISGSEQNINFFNWKDLKFVDEHNKNVYKIMDIAPSPILIQVHSLAYLPPDLREYNRTGWFDYKDKKVMIATNLDRGIDLPDDNCRSIIILKHPRPDTKDPVIDTLKRTLGEIKFGYYYEDLTDRNLIQQISRGIRNRKDWCNIYTLDANVYNAIYKYKDFFNYNLIKVNGW